MKIYCDGATDRICFVFAFYHFYDCETAYRQETYIKQIDKTTQNVAEYKAVIAALEEAQKQRMTGVWVLTDSQLVVNQINCLWQVRCEHLLPLRNRARELLLALHGAISWVPREENLAGKVLE